jgi:hypothetical protein
MVRAMTGTRKSKRRVGRAVVLCVLAVCGARYAAVLWDLESAERRAAWREIRDRGLRDLALSVDDPDAVRLWLKAGRDPNGHDCASFSDGPPSPLRVAFGRPLGLCGPSDGDEMPFLKLVVRPYTERRLAAALLMIDAGVDVNEASPEGVLPLRAAVAARNRPLVERLLRAGADPDLRSGSGDSDEFMSARQLADRYPSDPEMRSFADLMARKAIPGSAERSGLR